MDELVKRAEVVAAPADDDGAAAEEPVLSKTQVSELAAATTSIAKIWPAVRPFARNWPSSLTLEPPSPPCSSRR